MTEIEIGEIVIAVPEVETKVGWKDAGPITGKTVKQEVRAEFRFYGDGSSGTANFGLMMEHHPELEVHADAIRHYMKQQARRVLGNDSEG